MSGTLLPTPRLQALDAGVALSGAKLYIYSAGTTTPVTTYSDVSLATPNANPVVADADGLFGPIYIGPISVKVVLKDANDVTIFTQDNIAATGLTALNSVSNGIADGRLSASSGDAAPDSSTTGSTLYYVPYVGNRIALYDGTQWNTLTFTLPELSNDSLGGNIVWDIFAYDNNGTVTLEKVQWTDATTRATALTRQDGVLVKSGDATRRYLGTIRSSSLSQYTESEAKRFIWNMYNRVPRRLRRVESTDSWAYTTATLRSANGDTANMVEVVVGQLGVSVHLHLIAFASNTSAGVSLSVSIGRDSTTAAAANCIGMLGDTNVATQRIGLQARLDDVLTVAPGYHTYNWLEYSGAAGATTWYGDAGVPLLGQAGMSGFLFG